MTRTLCSQCISSTTPRGMRMHPFAPLPSAATPSPRPRTATTTTMHAAAGAAAPLSITSDDLGYLPPTNQPLKTFGAHLRALLFFSWTLILAVPMFFLLMLPVFPFVWIWDRTHRTAEHVVNNIWAVMSTLPFFWVEVRGRRNLPPPQEAVMLVANHQSFMDIYSLFHLGRFFKFVSKTSNFLIPIVGWSMYLTGHVGLKRTDKRSQMQVLKECRALLQAGCSLLFFPEGTRTRTGRMGSFKKGAFAIAAKEKVAVVPITIDGAGPIMPNGREGEMWPGKVIITIHPPIRGGSDQELCDATQEAIASALPEHLRPDPNATEEEN